MLSEESVFIGHSNIRYFVLDTSVAVKSALQATPSGSIG
jgi:hypothetical protein